MDGLSRQTARPGRTAKVQSRCSHLPNTPVTNCVLTTVNSEWYFQCVPIEDTNNPNIVTQTITTIFSIVGPLPTAVTTYITYITAVPDDPLYDDDDDETSD